MSEPVDRAKLEEAISCARNVMRAPGVQTVVYQDDLRRLLAAAEAHLATLPKTKMVEVWRVEFAFADGLGWHARTATFKSEDDALAAIKGNSKSLSGKWSCIRLTGPHSQEIPA